MTTSSKESHPSILLITTDEQPFDTLGCNGNDTIRTPNLDRIASEGINFQSHSCSNPICTPARVSLLTGQYSRTHGAYTVGVDYDTDTQVLPHWLGDAGYLSCLVGKAHFEPQLSKHVENRPEGASYAGFSEAYLTEDNQIGPYLAWVQREHPELYDEVRRNSHEDDTDTWGTQDGKLRAAYKSTLPEEVHPTTWITDRSIDFIRKCKKGKAPFFLWTSYVDPHHPFNPVEPYASMYDPEELPDFVPEVGAHGGPTSPTGKTTGSRDYNDGRDLGPAEIQRMRALYYGMISHIDTQVGRLIDELDTADILEETIVIFTSDHGDYNGNRKMVRKLAGLYDDVLRVPLLIRVPSSVNPGNLYSGLTQHEDLPPTILDLIGLEIPDSVQGISFKEALVDQRWEGRPYSYFEFYTGEVAPVVGIRKGEWKLIYYHRGEKWVLTNTLKDPYETKNLIDRLEYENVVLELKDVLEEWQEKYPARRLPRHYMY